MSSKELLERLARHRVLAAVPRGEIAWIAEHAVLRRLERGQVLTSKDGPVEGLHVVLDGDFSIHVDRAAGPRKIMEWRGGDVIRDCCPARGCLRRRRMSSLKSRRTRSPSTGTTFL